MTRVCAREAAQHDRNRYPNCKKLQVHGVKMWWRSILKKRRRAAETSWPTNLALHMFVTHNDNDCNRQWCEIDRSYWVIISHHRCSSSPQAPLMVLCGPLWHSQTGKMNASAQTGLPCTLVCCYCPCQMNSIFLIKIEDIQMRCGVTTGPLRLQGSGRHACTKLKATFAVGRRKHAQTV